MFSVVSNYPVIMYYDNIGYYDLVVRDGVFQNRKFGICVFRSSASWDAKHYYPRLPPAGGGGGVSARQRTASDRFASLHRSHRAPSPFFPSSTTPVVQTACARTVFRRRCRRWNDATPGVVCQVSGAPARPFFASISPANSPTVAVTQPVPSASARLADRMGPPSRPSARPPA